MITNHDIPHSMEKDVLCIPYDSLASNGLDRLALLAALGSLMKQTPGYYAFQSLHLTNEVGQRLKVWLAIGHADFFWRNHEDGIRVHRRCERHVIIGTNLLLRDLAECNVLSDLGKQAPITSPSQSKIGLDAVWRAAHIYIAQEVQAGS